MIYTYRLTGLLALFAFTGMNASCVDIFHAIKTGSKKQVKRWSEAKKDVNQLNEDGQSALIVAAACGNARMIKKILESQIDVNIVDNFGKTALDWAVAQGKFKVIAPLIIANGKVAQKDSVRAIQKMFEQRASRRLIASQLALLLLIPFFLLIERHPAAAWSVWAVSMSASLYSLIALWPGAENAFCKSNKDYFFDCLLLDNYGSGQIV